MVENLRHRTIPAQLSHKVRKLCSFLVHPETWQNFFFQNHMMKMIITSAEQNVIKLTGFLFYSKKFLIFVCLWSMVGWLKSGTCPCHWGDHRGSCLTNVHLIHPLVTAFLPPRVEFLVFLWGSRSVYGELLLLISLQKAKEEHAAGNWGNRRSCICSWCHFAFLHHLLHFHKSFPPPLHGDPHTHARICAHLRSTCLYPRVTGSPAGGSSPPSAVSVLFQLLTAFTS